MDQEDAGRDGGRLAVLDSSLRDEISSALLCLALREPEIKNSNRGDFIRDWGSMRMITGIFTKSMKDLQRIANRDENSKMIVIGVLSDCLSFLSEACAVHWSGITKDSSLFRNRIIHVLVWLVAEGDKKLLAEIISSLMRYYYFSTGGGGYKHIFSEISSQELFEAIRLQVVEFNKNVRKKSYNTAIWLILGRLVDTSESMSVRLAAAEAVAQVTEEGDATVIITIGQFVVELEKMRHCSHSVLDATGWESQSLGATGREFLTRLLLEGTMLNILDGRLTVRLSV